MTNAQHLLLYAATLLVAVFVGAAFFRLVDIDEHLDHLTVTCVTQGSR